MFTNYVSFGFQCLVFRSLLFFLKFMVCICLWACFVLAVRSRMDDSLVFSQNPPTGVVYSKKMFSLKCQRFSRFLAAWMAWWHCAVTSMVVLGQNQDFFFCLKLHDTYMILLPFKCNHLELFNFMLSIIPLWMEMPLPRVSKALIWNCNKISLRIRSVYNTSRQPVILIELYNM